MGKRGRVKGVKKGKGLGFWRRVKVSSGIWVKGVGKGKGLGWEEGNG